MRKWMLLFVLMLAAGLVLAGCQSGAQTPAQQPEAEAGQLEKQEEQMEGEMQGEMKEEGGQMEDEEYEEKGEMGGMAAKGDPKRGEQLFNQTVLGQNAGCMTCHSLEPDVTLVGPSLAGIATRAAERVPGMSAEQYLMQSLMEPDAYVVEGFPSGVMPSYKDLPEQDLADLIAFMMTLK